MALRISTTLAIGVALLGLVAANPAQAVNPVVAVLTIEVQGDLDQYLGYVRRLSAIAAKHQGGRTRVYRATYAGSNTNTVFVTLEYSNHAALATAQARLESDAEWQKAMGELTAAGLRSVVSRSLLEEITPK